MFKHQHPYPPFIPKDTTKLIVGTLPPPRFSFGNLKKGDVDFCYGSIDGLLWKVLGNIFNLNLKYENSKFAIAQRKNFLIQRNIGICDIVESCKRKKIDASDLGMEQIELRDFFFHLNNHPKIDTLLLTGGNSKNGPEYHLRKILKKENISFEEIDAEHPKMHCFTLNDSGLTPYKSDFNIFDFQS